MSATDALSMSERGQAVFVDVRSREAYAAGHIPGA
jgi:rhodanese-related sulfurtransferase